MNTLIEDVEKFIDDYKNRPLMSAGMLIQQLKAAVARVRKTLAAEEAQLKSDMDHSKELEASMSDALKEKIEAQKPTAPASFQDYDAGLLNTYGGGNTSWWLDYIRGELERCNEHWREQIASYHPETPTADKGLIEELTEQSFPLDRGVFYKIVSRYTPTKYASPVKEEHATDKENTK